MDKDTVLAMHGRIQAISSDDDFLVINVFHQGPYGPPSRSIWTQRAQTLFEGVHTSITKETYNL